MSNRAKARMWKVIGLICCVTPPLSCLITCAGAWKNPHWWNYIGPAGMAVAAVILIVFSRYIKTWARWFVSAPVLGFGLCWLILSGVSAVIGDIVMVLKMGTVGSAIGAVCDLAAWRYRSRERREDNESRSV